MMVFIILQFIRSCIILSHLSYSAHILLFGDSIDRHISTHWCESEAKHGNIVNGTKWAEDKLYYVGKTKAIGKLGTFHCSSISKDGSINSLAVVHMFGSRDTGPYFRDITQNDDDLYVDTVLRMELAYNIYKSQVVLPTAVYLSFIQWDIQDIQRRLAPVIKDSNIWNTSVSNFRQNMNSRIHQLRQLIGSDNVSIGLRTAVPCGHDSVEMLIEFNEIVRQLARDENLLLYDDSFDVLTSIYFNNEHEVSNADFAAMCFDHIHPISLYSVLSGYKLLRLMPSQFLHDETNKTPSISSTVNFPLIDIFTSYDHLSIRSSDNVTMSSNSIDFYTAVSNCEIERLIDEGIIWLYDPILKYKHIKFNLFSLRMLRINIKNAITYIPPHESDLITTSSIDLTQLKENDIITFYSKNDSFNQTFVIHNFMLREFPNECVLNSYKSFISSKTFILDYSWLHYFPISSHPVLPSLIIRNHVLCRAVSNKIVFYLFNGKRYMANTLKDIYDLKMDFEVDPLYVFDTRDLELIPDGGSLNAAVIKRILNYKEYTDKLADYSGWSIQEFIATD